MYTSAELAAMSPEELAAAKAVLSRKVAFHLIVKPILIAAAVGVAVKVVEHYATKSDPED